MIRSGSAYPDSEMTLNKNDLLMFENYQVSFTILKIYP